MAELLQRTEKIPASAAALGNVQLAQAHNLHSTDRMVELLRKLIEHIDGSNGKEVNIEDALDMLQKQQKELEQHTGRISSSVISIENMQKAQIDNLYSVEQLFDLLSAHIKSMEESNGQNVNILVQKEMLQGMVKTLGRLEAEQKKESLQAERIEEFSKKELEEIVKLQRSLELLSKRDGIPR